VVECSASDLIGQYVGQTGPKTIKQLERGLGKVLFIDEAYRLGEGAFAQEAVNELVDTITKPQFAGKLVIILAGYDNDMNNLLRVNEGLSSRFSEEVVFHSLSANHCLQLLKDELNKSSIGFPSMKDPDMNAYLLDRIEALSKLPAWGNARDVQTLAKSMVRTVFESTTDGADELVLHAEPAKKCLETMLAERRARANVVPTSQPSFSGQAQTLNASHSLPKVSSSTSPATKPALKAEIPEKTQQQGVPDDGHRDPGVSDAVWQSLQIDKKLADVKVEQAKQAILKQEEEQGFAEEAEREAKEIAAALFEIQANDQAEADDLLRKREQARIHEMEARAERERIQRDIKRLRQEEMERRKKEARAQAKLREMGICPMGFRWVKQSGGYRCSAGGHWVNDSSLGL
jgi:hypothetical protein